ncbi:MAG TPA: NUDIX domain-containing protein [Terriglobia bacterium]|nr:NUDIX domain-containing protein [Terriglobia bacterium]
MAKLSAGLMMYRIRGGRVELLLVHPGGPFWNKKDAGAWSIPKGEISAEEDELEAARREFFEETGVLPKGEFRLLGEIVQKGGKVVRAWAFEGDYAPATLKSNTFTMEWPPRSGKQQEFPEIDRAAFFTPEEARKRINPAQAKFIDALELMTAERTRETD